jgi:hypothetical protein
VGDLEIASGQTRTLSGDTEVTGWVTVAGTLVVEGDLACLGVSVEAGGTLRCGRLVANAVEVDNLGGRAKLSATKIRARVVALVEVIGGDLGALLDGDGVEADYIHHFAGDLNPSFDYERGERGVLRAEYVEGEDPSLQLDLAGIRKALGEGKNPFARGEPIVERLVEQGAAPAAPPPSELANELAAWIAAHPGPQRALLVDLRAQWHARLAGADAAVGRTITSAIGSKKLAAERDAWLAELGLVREPAPARPPQRERLRVLPPPPRRDPGAWLDEHPRDATEISASSERIGELPARIGAYQQLSRLQLAYNKLARLPAELGRLAQLQYLDLQGNQLVELPDLAGLVRLESLNVEYNAQLVALPDSLCELANLTHLMIGHTAIASLPDGFGRLRALRHLGLHDCTKLVRLPESLFELPALDSIYLHGTRLPSSQIARLKNVFPKMNFWSFQ